MVERFVADVADVGAKIGEEAVGSLDALLALTLDRLGLNRVVPRWQAVDLVGAENTVAHTPTRNGRDEEASRIFCPNPRDDIGISFAVADLA